MPAPSVSDGPNFRPVRSRRGLLVRSALLYESDRLTGFIECAEFIGRRL